jgi:Na+/proline symporter
LAKAREVKIKRKIVAVIVGFIVVSLILFNGSLHLGIKGLWGVLIDFFVLPSLVGGFLAGYLVRKRGFVYGLIIGILRVTLYIIVWNFVLWCIYPHHFFKETTIRMIHWLWTIHLGFTFSTLIAGTVGGYLGQLLAQKWHKFGTRA